MLVQEEFKLVERYATIRDESGNVVARRRCDAPEGWSQLAVDVVGSKYLRGAPGDPDAEQSVEDLFERVTEAICREGFERGHYATTQHAELAKRRLKAALYRQEFAWNSPVWFNVGNIGERSTGWASGYSTGEVRPVKPGEHRPQASACFIQSVEDNMESILDLAVSEGMLFKCGSGTGTDLSTIRSTRESLSGGGKPSGPVSFMRVYDAIAGVVKSGGKTRRAAKMQTLKVTHPDIVEFIECKANEERKARALVEAGYDGTMNGEAYGTVSFQNANLSVRATDEFMQRASSSLETNTWHCAPVRRDRRPEGENAYPLDTGLTALQILDKIAEAAWECGDPGIQFEDTIQAWHTCPNSGPINSSNPCCFTYETLVSTSEGRIPIGKLAQMDAEGRDLPLAFSFDFGSGVPVLRKIKRAWAAGQTRRLVEVKTDKGLSFRCTPEHVFYLRDGTPVQAQDLESGMRLRKIGRGKTGSHPRTSIETKDGTFCQSRWMWEQANGPVPIGFEVHHKNEDRLDDRLSNLVLVEGGLHQKLHSIGLSNSNAIRCEDSLLVEVWEAVESTPKKTHKSKGPSVTPARWNSYVKKAGLQGQVPLARGDGRIRGASWREFSEWIEESRCLVNDRVDSVEFVHGVTEGTYVYDIEVEGTHNFEITCDGARHGIIVSNSEYMFLDDSACNLASINLLKFLREDNTFEVSRFVDLVYELVTTMDILVDFASYPTRRIAENSRDFRPLGLGYANLGALIMCLGYAYDSPEGRTIAASITALMHFAATRASVDLAGVPALGVPDGLDENRGPYHVVFGKHANALDMIASDVEPSRLGDPAVAFCGPILNKAKSLRDACRRQTPRNSQLTVLAPTGTISFLMDCDTTGIEPDIALAKYKNLAGGGVLKIVNRSVPAALKSLGYSPEDRGKISAWVEDHGTPEGCPVFDPEHLPVFDCAFPPPGGTRSIPWRAHVEMMAAVQPFLSGAISKTVNMPRDSTPEDIREAFTLAWKLGLKSIAVYRDGSKGGQPVVTKKPEKSQGSPDPAPETAGIGADLDPGVDHDELAYALERAGAVYRVKPPRERPSVTSKIQVQGFKGYLTVGYSESTWDVLEFFVSSRSEPLGTAISLACTLASKSIQFGVPLPEVLDTFGEWECEPKGATFGDLDVPFCRSIYDLVARKVEAIQKRLHERADERGVATWLDPAPPGPPARLETSTPCCPRCKSPQYRRDPCEYCPDCNLSGGCG